MPRFRPIFELLVGLESATSRGEHAVARSILGEIEINLQQRSSEIQASTRAYIASLPGMEAMVTPPAADVPMGEQRGATGQPRPSNYGHWHPSRASGVSVVTCSMNRTENLLRALPSWLDLDEVREVVVVDWSSRVPVLEALDSSGLRRDKVRVLRIEQEVRWQLAPAFNVGLKAARYDSILKLDADILLEPSFFAENHLAKGWFVAGNWEKASPGQEHINGLLYAWATDLEYCGGYNEYIRSYGWDDDDIYSRLTLSGLKRADVIPNSLFHMPHGDVARLGTEPSAGQTALDGILRDPLYNIRASRYIANNMPPWTGMSPSSQYLQIEGDPNATTLLRIQSAAPANVSSEIYSQSFDMALREIASWRYGPEIFSMSISSLRAFLASLPANVAHVLAPTHRQAEQTAVLHVLFSSVAAPLPEAHARLIPALLAKGRFTSLMFVGPDTSPAIHELCARLRPSLVVEHVREIDASTEVSTVRGCELLDAAVPGGSVAIDLEEFQSCLSNFLREERAAPDIGLRRKLYIEAAHGLGNRMRAFASAAAIAEATDRELVLVWIPDDHCQILPARIASFPCHVVSQRSHALVESCCYIEYLDGAPGSIKDEATDELFADGTKDIYVRSSSTIQHSSSNWTTENLHLRSVEFVPAVRQLLAPFPQHFDLTVHIRMVGGNGQTLASYDGAHNWTESAHEMIQANRSKSHVRKFIEHIRQSERFGKAANSIFVAADCEEGYVAMRNAFPGQIFSLDRKVYDRSEEQIIYAAADALLLARGRAFLGSNWSSFSELAVRLSGTFESVAMAGVDF